MVESQVKAPPLLSLKKGFFNYWCLLPVETGKIVRGYSPRILSGKILPKENNNYGKKEQNDSKIIVRYGLPGSNGKSTAE